MADVSLGNESLPAIFCSSEWHLRKNPRAFMIYSLALRITDGGKNEFFLSQPQLAMYFGWDVKTVRAAFRAVRAEGLFALRREGRGGNGKANYASVYRVIPHSQLANKTKCWPGAMQDRHRTDTELTQGDGGNSGPVPLPKTSAYALPTAGSLVSDHSPIDSTNPSQGDGRSDFPASPLRSKPKPITEKFRPDISNEQFAMKNGLNLEEEIVAFTDLHGAIGNERRNWQSLFRQHLKDAAWHRGRVPVPDWMPMAEWNAYLAMRAGKGKVASQPAQKIAVRLLTEMRENGQNVAAVLNQSTQNAWTSVFPIGRGRRAKAKAA